MDEPPVAQNLKLLAGSAVRSGQNPALQIPRWKNDLADRGIALQVFKSALFCDNSNLSLSHSARLVGRAMKLVAQIFETISWERIAAW